MNSDSNVTELKLENESNIKELKLEDVKVRLKPSLA
jgi:hypothetical protein